MKAVVYRLSITRVGLARLVPSLGLGAMRLEEVPAPGRDGWTRVDVRSCGVCGSDLALIAGKSSPSLSPFSSFPAVLGHEIFGRAGGKRVVVDPYLGCAERGLPACASCRDGRLALCTNAAEGALAPGMLVGFCRDAPGGWAEATFAPRDHVLEVPDAVPDDHASIVEPLAVGVHAVERSRPAGKVLVVGGGMLAYAVVAAIKMLRCDADVTQSVALPFQAELSFADRTICGGLEKRAAEITGAKTYVPIQGPATFAGGFDAVYDCVGSAKSLSDALRLLRPRGTLVLVGCAGDTRVDWTPVWHRELTIHGVAAYERDTFAKVLSLLAGCALPLGRLVTHRFELKDWKHAVRASFDRAGARSVKVLIGG
jgi:threonine dehydrogenase-like Zn-dependent dehydrogenase